MAAMDVENVEKDVDKRTLSSFIMSETKNLEMTILMNAIQLSCKLIARACRKAGVASLYGLAGGSNASGLNVDASAAYAARCAASAVAFSIVTGALPGPWTVHGNAGHTSGKEISAPHCVTGPQCMKSPNLASPNHSSPGARPVP